MGLWRAALYNEMYEVDVDEQQISVSMRLPVHWQVASALPKSENDEKEENARSFRSVSLRTLVDSPMMLYSLRRQRTLPWHHLLQVLQKRETFS